MDHGSLLHAAKSQVRAVALGASQTVAQGRMEQQAAAASRVLERVLQFNCVHTRNSVVNLPSWTADSEIGLNISVLTGHALTVAWIEQPTRGVHIHAFSKRIQILVLFASLEENALPVL